MILELSPEAVDFGRVAHQALESAGGDRLAQGAELYPDERGGLVEPVLADLGAWQLEPRKSSDELEAAAALCRAAGYWAVPYPVAERLSRPTDIDVDGLVVVAGVDPAGAVAGLDLRWAAVTLDGDRSLVRPQPTSASERKALFVTRLELEPVDRGGQRDVPLGLVLPCWTLLGMLDRALDLTRSYVREREQFGQTLASFQSVQFQLTDAEVERVGVEELAKYALWSVEAGHDEAFDDALALRLAAVEAADTVFGVAHQLHGAIGFCDETPLSWVSRYSTPLRRLPTGLSATRHQLTASLGSRGLTGLFG
jgi:Acyl-CoA dehydrogenase, C-terminal domain